MTTTDLSIAAGARSQRLFVALVMSGIGYVLATRLWLASDLPLWLDETWSAMIATRGDWPSFWREVWLDCNPPLYYLFLKLWVAVFGDTNFALRLPSFLFVLAACTMPIVWPPKGLNRTGSYTWAVLLLLWAPGVYMMLDARAYGLLLLLSTVSCLLFARLYDRPRIVDGASWVAIGTALFLTHYFSATLLAGQALVLLYRHRIGVLKLWPAALISLPGLAWFAYHLPRLSDYARPDVVWYQQTTPLEAFHYAALVFGGESWLILLLIGAAVFYAAYSKKGKSSSTDLESGPPLNGLKASAVAGLVGVALTIVFGALQASLTARYLAPLVPPAMLGLALLAQDSARQNAVSAMLIVTFFIPHLNGVRVARLADQRYLYGYERGSDFLAAYRPTDLLFLWDHPATKILDKGSLAGIGAYFLHRQGVPVRSAAIVVTPGDNPNVLLKQRASGPRPAIIWLYNTARRSVARDHPPALQRDGAWACQHYRSTNTGGAKLGAMVCAKTDAANERSFSQLTS